MKRYTTRIGIGVDVVNGDVTQAALLAISNANRTCLSNEQVQYSLSAEEPASARLMGVRLHSPTPEKIDLDVIKERYRRIEQVEVVQGGVAEMGISELTGQMRDNIVIVVATVLSCDEMVAVPVGRRLPAQVVAEDNRVVVYHTVDDRPDGGQVAALF